MGGFCYIEARPGHGRYVANSGLIVPAESGVAKSIKQKIFNLSRQNAHEARCLV